jgi:hypothetical protein
VVDLTFKSLLSRYTYLAIAKGNPGGITVGKLGALIAGAGVTAISDAKEIERHGENHC